MYAVVTNKVCICTIEQTNFDLLRHVNSMLKLQTFRYNYFVEKDRVESKIETDSFKLIEWTFTNFAHTINLV